MALEGEIVIWSYSKLLSKFPEVLDNEKIGKIIGGYLYQNPFKNEETLLICYCGDNLYFPNGFYPLYEPEQWLQSFSNYKLSAPEKKKLIKILEYLINECYVAKWLVWQ